MTLMQPTWLVVAIPLLFVFMRWPIRERTLLALRVIVLVLIVVALARPAVLLPRSGGTVVVVADRSRSMPDDVDRLQTEVIKRLDAEKDGDQRLAVVSFAETAAVNVMPDGGSFSGFGSDVGADQSVLNDGLSLGLSLLPEGESGRLLVLSDGRWTGEDPIQAAANAASHGISVDVVNLARDVAGDLAIDRIEAPVSVSRGEAFLIVCWVRSSSSREIDFTLRRGSQVIANGSRRIVAGLNRLTLRDRADHAGTLAYGFEVSSDATDPVPQNNVAKFLVSAEGTRRLLHVGSSADSGLVRLLSSTDIQIVSMRPEQVDWDLAFLAGFEGLIIENVPAGEIGRRGLANVAGWVRAGAGGLLVTGGRRSFGSGGYYRTPVEDVLPVSMELRQEHRKLSLAVVVALDRSGSMRVEVGAGRTKMDLANLASAEIVDVLTPMDQVGVIAVDSSAHMVAPLEYLIEPNRLRSKILTIESMGGGIFVYEALSTAVAMLVDAESGTRHVLLFADAADAEQPGEYRELLRHCESANITVSVIGLGSPADTDAAFLRDVAARGRGNIFFTTDPYELPRLFAQDTFLMSRSTFIEAPTSLRTTGGLFGVLGLGLSDPPSVEGYNLCYLRPGASAAILTDDEYAAPLLSTWYVNVGRAAALTTEIDGTYAGDLARWSHTGDLLAGLGRWVMGADQSMPDGMMVAQTTDRGMLKIRLHLAPDREIGGEPTDAAATVVQAKAGGESEIETRTLRRIGVDTLGVDVPIKSERAAIATVHLGREHKVSMPPVCLPYSPELAYSAGVDGGNALAKLARMTGGEQRRRPETIWQDIPKSPRFVHLAPGFYLLAIVMLLLEVAQRRTGAVGSAMVWIFGWRPKIRPLRKQTEDEPKFEDSAPSPVVETVKATAAEPGPAPEPEAPTGNLLDALEKAKSRRK